MNAVIKSEVTVALAGMIGVKTWVVTGLKCIGQFCFRLAAQGQLLWVPFSGHSILCVSHLSHGPNGLDKDLFFSC